MVHYTNSLSDVNVLMSQDSYPIDVSIMKAIQHTLKIESDSSLLQLCPTCSQLMTEQVFKNYGSLLKTCITYKFHGQEKTSEQHKMLNPF
jgi:hypothetical protein